MTTSSTSVALGTANTQLASCAAGMENILFGLVFSNTTGAPRTVTLAHHVAALGTTVSVPFVVAANAVAAWDKAIGLQPGDTLGALADATGVTVVVSQSLETGASPVASGFTLRGPYSATATYAANDVVGFGGSSYGSLVGGNVGHQPDTSPAQWMVVAATSSSIREVLTANRDYYVSTTGSDANTGLASGTAFLTIGRALDVCRGLDFNGFSVLVHVGAGAWSEQIVVPRCVGIRDPSSLTIQGDTTTPANVTLSNSSGNTVLALAQASATIQGFKFTGTGGGVIFIDANNLGTLNVQQCEFGGAGAYHLYARNGGVIIVTGGNTVSGGAVSHARTEAGGRIIATSRAVTVTGTPAFSGGFINVELFSYQEWTGFTFTGSPTGPRYFVNANSVLYTSGGGSSYFPGSSAGSATNGGIYL